MAHEGRPKRPTFRCYDYVYACLYPVIFVVLSAGVSGAILYVSHRSLLGRTDASEEMLDGGTKNGWFEFANVNMSTLSIFGWASLMYIPYGALVLVGMKVNTGYGCLPTCSEPVHEKARSHLGIVHLVALIVAYAAVTCGGAMGIERFNNSILSAQGGLHRNMDPTKPLDAKIKGGVIQFKPGTFMNMKQTGVYYEQQREHSPWTSIVAVPIVAETTQTNIFYWGGGCADNSECVSKLAPMKMFHFGLSRPKGKATGPVCDRWQRVSAPGKGAKSNITMGIILRNAPNCNPRGARVEATSLFKLKTDQKKAVTIRVHEDPAALIKLMALAGLRSMLIPTGAAHALYLIVLYVVTIRSLRNAPADTDRRGAYQRIETTDNDAEAGRAD